MGLFSRRKKSDPVPERGIEAGEQPVDESAPVDVLESAPVEISVSPFRGLGSEREASTVPATQKPTADAEPVREPLRRGAEVAPEASESIPGLRDNALLRQALAGLSTTPTAPELMNVARQLLQGHVFLRVQGDARELLAEGKPLPLSVASRGDTQYVLVYSGGAALQDAVRADGDTNTSAAGQPVVAVLRHVLAGSFGGLILDNSSAPARAVLPRPLLERALGQADEQLRLKTLLAAARTDATAAEAASLLSEVPVWIAVRTTEAGPIGVAESRTADGERYLELFSHPLEALALGRGDNAAPLTAVQLATALSRDTGLSGVIVDPAGPWIRLSRADLAPVLALAPTDN